MNERLTWGLGGLAGATFVMCLIGGVRLGEARAAADDAANNLLRMQRLVQEIETLRKLDNNAHSQGEQAVESSQAFSKYAEAAGIASKSIADIERHPIKQFDGTSYRRDDVGIRLEGVSAEQIVRFLIQCGDASVGYSADSVLMREFSSNTGGEERWTANLILTRILYVATNRSSE